MKIDGLFVAFGGYSKKIDAFNKENLVSGYVIVKTDEWHNTYYYDVISGKKYLEYNAWEVKDKDSIIINHEPLYLFLSQKSNKYPELQKFATKSRLSKNEIKELILILNKDIYKEEFNSLYNRQNKSNNKSTNDNSNNNQNLNFISYLTGKKFKNEPCIGRDNEVNEIIITLAQDKKNPILVGESGTGKTTIVDQLAYMIQKNEVPNFLKNKKIIEIDLANLLSETKFQGVLEGKVTKMIDFAVKKDAILFIDEIHTIYGAGTHDKSDYDIAAMIKQAIDRQGLKIIGTTTTEEYDKYFSNDALRRRFEKIIIKEPIDKILYQIINKVFIDYSKKNNIKLLDNMSSIISTLVNMTNFKHRTWDDKICNPDLVIGIIDRIFADAKVNDQDKLTIENIVYGIKSCNRIYDSVKETSIYNLDIEEETYQNEKAKIIQLKKKN